MAVMGSVQDSRSAQQAAEKLKKIDYKMVSFTLAGKDYGIDIMKVKEIRKAGNFTFVPNTPLFVRGVDNLRGDIIPIIDLRIMFNLPAERKNSNELENIIILRMDELIMGIIVDDIEKVIGISKESIQPPHPIFGDINVKYISGVVEHESKLYIILDVERIFHQKNEVKEVKAQTSMTPEAIDQTKANSVLEEAPVVQNKPLGKKNEVIPYAQEKAFVVETLGTFQQFYTTGVNDEWVTRRVAQWVDQKKQGGQEYQLSSSEDAQAFLLPFYSPFNGRLWTTEYSQELGKVLDYENSKSITVWNPGCGKGCESYSLGVLLESLYPGKNYKIWASDFDLLNISMAPSLTFSDSEIDSLQQPYLIEVKAGKVFKPEIKSKIMFEYHDINHLNPFTQLDLVVCRDVISFLKPDQQEKILDDMCEKLKRGGLLILGLNERVLSEQEWEKVELANWSLYKKR